MKAKEFVEIAKRFANGKSVYMLGALCQPVTEELINYKENQWTKNKQWDSIFRSRMGYIAADCCCLLKAICYGATPENPSAMKYKSNNVPDVGANETFELCTDKSTDFSHIEIGEFCWMDGHVGVYVGNGLSVEATPAHANGIQFSACNCKKDGYWTRTWTAHGKSPWIEYEEDTNNSLVDKWEDKAYECLKDVIKGKYGNSTERERKLAEVGESIGADGTEFWKNVQDLVNICVIRYNWKTDFRLAPKDWSKSLSKHEGIPENCWLHSTKGYTRERAEALVKALKEKGYEFSIEVK